MQRHKWLRIEEDGWSIIIPDFDILPHFSTQEVSTKEKYELGGWDCKCKPKIDWQDRMIIHNSFQDSEIINKALNAKP